MPNCQSIDPFVTSYIDDQLPDADRRRVDDHLRVCPPCHSRVEAERAVHDLLVERRDELAACCAPRSLHEKCRGAFHDSNAAQDSNVAQGSNAAQGSNVAQGFSPGDAAQGSAVAQGFSPANRRIVPASRATGWRARFAPLALAASLVLVVGTAFLYQLTASSSRVLAAELAADHMKCFALNDVLGTHQEAAAVESSMLSGFGWRMELPSAASRAGLELVGSRPCLYGEGKIAHIMYRHHGDAVSLFMLPRESRTQELVDVLGHRAAIWCNGDRTFVLLAREPKDDVQRLAAVIQASLR